MEILIHGFVQLFPEMLPAKNQENEWGCFNPDFVPFRLVSLCVHKVESRMLGILRRSRKIKIKCHVLCHINIIGRFWSIKVN